MSAAGAHRAKFVTGPTMRHVVVMTATGSVGLVAIFIVDALNLFYISLLGVQELAAAVGFASTVLFFTVSISIGLTIAAGALVSRAIGRGDHEEAARMGGASLLFMGAIQLLIVLGLWPFLHEVTALLGARGQTLEMATGFLRIVVPSSPIVALGMATTGILRGVADARRAMFVTLSSAIATAMLDPLLIFGLGWGLDGAAISTVLSRTLMLVVGLHGAHTVHRLVVIPDRTRLAAALAPFLSIAVPAMLTQVAAPVGNAFVTAEIARFGDDAVAGWAIVGRIIPVAFGAIFALAGAVGPIIGQNYGARRYDRLRMVLRDSLIFMLVYVTAVWALLALFHDGIATLFGASGEAHALISFFCLFAAGSFLFYGALFVANAAFNNLGFAAYATFFNWGRSTLGVIPFVWAGAHLYGAVGVLAGWGLGAVVFGIAAILTSFRVVRHLAGQPPHEEDLFPDPPPASQSPFSSGKASTIQ